MRYLIFIVTALWVSACVSAGSEEEYERVVSSWVGAQEADLVSVWGVPDRTYDAEDGTRLITYDRRSQGQYTSPSSTTGTYNPYLNTYSSTTTGGTTHTYNYQCETTFKIENGEVTSWKYRGNACKQ